MVLRGAEIPRVMSAEGQEVKLYLGTVSKIIGQITIRLLQ